MIMFDKAIQILEKYTFKYLQMDVGELRIHCPYWKNKIKFGRVVTRGFANGKGSAEEIREALISKWREESNASRIPLGNLSLIKLAKRNRIGIDCSGLVYRILDEGIKSGIFTNRIKSLDEIFKQGINRTNANLLTGDEFAYPITDLRQIKTGDLIRINGGKHVAFIMEGDGKKIIYIHSHDQTEDQGVHKGVIQIADIRKPLDDQKWQEKTGEGINFRERYFHPEKGDGIRRLKILN